MASKLYTPQVAGGNGPRPGAGGFTGGSDNSEARVSGNKVLVDTNGDGLTDISIAPTGLTSAAQLTDSDFLFS